MWMKASLLLTKEGYWQIYVQLGSHTGCFCIFLWIVHSTAAWKETKFLAFNLFQVAISNLIWNLALSFWKKLASIKA